MTPQSRTTEEAIGRHDTARHEVSPIKERTYWGSKEVEEGSEWLIPPLRGINSSRNEIYKAIMIYKEMVPKLLVTLLRVKNTYAAFGSSANSSVTTQTGTMELTCIYIYIYVLYMDIYPYIIHTYIVDAEPACATDWIIHSSAFFSYYTSGLL